MSKNVPRFYWDSSIFIMLLKGETAHGQDVLDGARDVFQATESGDAIIVASEVVVAEVLPAGFTTAVFDKWEACLQWENMHLRAADHAVCTKAAKLRSDCLKKRPKVKIHLADALHVATYLIYGNLIDELHSVDEDFALALRHSGETRTPTVPKRIQITLEEGLFAEDETPEEPDELDIGAEAASGEEA